MVGLVSAGLIVLNQGAKLITDNAVAVAKNTHRSRFLVGTLVVSTLAALPEVLVSVFALHPLGNQRPSPEIAMSNALASHVVTISFVIGLPAILAPIAATREIVLRDAIFLMTVTIVASALLLDGELSFLDGIALMALFIPYTINLLIAPRTVKEEELEQIVEEQKVEMEYMGHLFGKEVHLKRGGPWLVFGVLWCIMGAQFVVQGSIELSRVFGIRQWLIGITVVAIGTSLPDIAASLHATRRGFTDLALGEGIGANIFTTLLTLGLMGVTSPAAYDRALLIPVIASVNGVTFLLVILMLGRWQISRIGGTVLLFSYSSVVVAGILGEVPGVNLTIGPTQPTLGVVVGAVAGAILLLLLVLRRRFLAPLLHRRGGLHDKSASGHRRENPRARNPPPPS